jgi:hypothetical protein
MESDLINIKLPRIILTACLLLFMQQLNAQDSSSGSAKISISFSEKDSVRQVIANLTNAGAAVKDIDIHFYVKKEFWFVATRRGLYNNR